MRATERERAIVAALAAGFVADWVEAYILSRETPTQPERERNRNNLRATVTRWKQRAEIAGAYNDAIATLKGREETTRAKEREQVLSSFDNKEGEKERTENGRKRAVDYNDPQERKRAYNRIISESADDPKTQLDALKVFEQLQRDDKQAAKDNQIQRFYTPQRCSTCPLYTKAAKNLTI